MPDVTVYDEQHRPLIGVEVEEYSLDTGGTIALATSSLSGIASFPDTSLNVHFRPRITRRSGKVGDLAHNGLVEIHRPLPVVETPVEEAPTGWFARQGQYNGGDFGAYMANDAFSRDCIFLIQGNGSFTTRDVSVLNIAPVIDISIENYSLAGVDLGHFPPFLRGIFAVWATGPHPSLTGGNMGFIYARIGANAAAPRGPSKQANPIIATATGTLHDDSYITPPATINMVLATNPGDYVCYLCAANAAFYGGYVNLFGLADGLSDLTVYGIAAGQTAPHVNPFGFDWVPDGYLGTQENYFFNWGAVNIKRNF